MSKRGRSILTIAVTIVSIICCCLGLGLYWDGYYLPNKPCRPITYPAGKRTTSDFIYTGTESIETILRFYDEQLDIQPYPGDTGQWIRETLPDSRYLYSCFGNDINGMTTETGCIYISSDGMTSRITTDFFRSEGGHIPCAR